MMTVSVIAFSFLLSTVKEESKTLFHGEDFHIFLPSLGVEVTFQPSDRQAADVVLMRGGNVVSRRAKLNRQLSHLILDAVGEADEGVYTVKNPETPDDVRRFKIIVRDCTNEQSIKYGDNYHIQLLGVTAPITLEYRNSALEANLTSRPALVLLTSTGLSRGGYQGRISINDRHVTLRAVTGADMGSYTVRDAEGKIERKVCLNVKEHQNFVKMPYGGTLKISLILNSSLVQLHYTPDYDPTSHLLMDKGELTSAQKELGLEGRLSLDDSVVILDQVKSADAGRFSVTDILGFPVSNTYLEVQPYRLDSVYVAVIALLGLVVLLLLVCLLSCLVKVKKRAKRDAALKKIADNAGKEDEGDAFRQVVKNITKLNEDSKHSQADNTEKSQSTEVDIKGLEVSSKEVGVGNLETSDSGVGFNTTALPLDTDTDAPDQIPDSEATKPSAPPAIEIQPSPVAEPKSSPTPETKKTPDQPADVPKAVDLKPSPVQIPESKPGLSPVSKPSAIDGLDAKTPEPKPAPSPSPEPKPASPKTTTATPESKNALTPTPEPSKPTTPEPVPIANGTPEPESKPSPDPADLIGGSAPKAAPAKTPEVELNSSSPLLDASASKDGAAAEDSTTTT
ncbi:uncharacterized protein [Centroberyx affinis]|uniref:uncharacterized protein n=1 Tax=Centroberyx affinis TaxID=166261 RepID=UPI003A5BADD3